MTKVSYPLCYDWSLELTIAIVLYALIGLELTIAILSSML